MSFYDNWPRPPRGAYLIDITRENKTYSVDGPFKTFNVSSAWNGFTYVLKGKDVRFPWSITPTDKKVIRRAAPELWKLGDDKANMLKAAPILLTHAKKLKAIS